MLLPVSIMISLISHIDSRRGDNCDIIAIEKQAKLDEDCLCVLDSQYCSNVSCCDDQEKANQLLSSDINDFAAFLLADSYNYNLRGPLSAMYDDHTQNSQIDENLTTVHTVWVMGYTDVQVADTSIDRATLLDLDKFPLVLPFKFGKYLQYQVSKDEVLFHVVNRDTSTNSISGYWRYVNIEIDDKKYSKIPAIWCDKNHDSPEILLLGKEFYELFTITMDKKRE